MRPGLAGQAVNSKGLNALAGRGRPLATRCGRKPFTNSRLKTPGQQPTFFRRLRTRPSHQESPRASRGVGMASEQHSPLYDLIELSAVSPLYQLSNEQAWVAAARILVSSMMAVHNVGDKRQTARTQIGETERDRQQHKRGTFRNRRPHLFPIEISGAGRRPAIDVGHHLHERPHGRRLVGAGFQFHIVFPILQPHRGGAGPLFRPGRTQPSANPDRGRITSLNHSAASIRSGGRIRQDQLPTKTTR